MKTNNDQSARLPPLVTVVMPAFNGEETIGQSIESVLKQTMDSLELIIIEDHSTDLTASIIQSFADLDSRIVFLRNSSNQGVSRSRNTGCRRARGKYIAFLDCDDIWTPDKLEKQVALMEREKAQLSFTAYAVMNRDGKTLRKVYEVPERTDYTGLLKENVIGCSTVLIRSDWMRRYSFSEEASHEDYTLWLRLLHDGIRAVGMNAPMMIYRRGGRSDCKIRASVNRWRVYRGQERLSFCRSWYYWTIYMVRGLLKWFL